MQSAWYLSHCLCTSAIFCTAYRPLKILFSSFFEQHVEEYKLILSGASGGANEKRLASQFIARFCKHFPSIIDQSFDVMMDLCEDSDVNVSMHNFYFVSHFICKL
jgi:Apoptosis inhibitory protein 5 (API5)